MTKSSPPIQPAEALETAKGAAKVGQLQWRVHANARGDERNAQAVDVRQAILTATSATWRAENQTWRLDGGKDLDNDDLTVAVAIEGNQVRVITVF